MPNKCTVAVQGFGNVGSISAKLMYEQGAKVIAISDVTGGYYNENGIDIPKAMEYYSAHGNSLEGYPEATPITNEDLLKWNVMC